MVRGPGPGLVARPVPAAIGPFPMTLRIWHPAMADIRVPTASIFRQINPESVRRERVIEVRNALNLDARCKLNSNLASGCEAGKAQDERG